MNESEIKYLTNYLKDKQNDRFSNYVCNINYRDSYFNFESVGLYHIKVVCGVFPMSYRLSDDFITCGCNQTQCNHKLYLKELITKIVDGKEF